MTCELNASGPDFDVDAFLRGSSLKPTKVLRKGELKIGKYVNDKAIITIAVSDADTEEPELQIDDAIELLEQNQQELERLRDFPGVVEIYLGFHIAEGASRNQADRFPAELLRLSGNLGIGIEIYRYP